MIDNDKRSVLSTHYHIVICVIIECKTFGGNDESMFKNPEHNITLYNKPYII